MCLMGINYTRKQKSTPRRILYSNRGSSGHRSLSSRGSGHSRIQRGRELPILQSANIKDDHLLVVSPRLSDTDPETLSLGAQTLLSEDITRRAPVSEFTPKIKRSASSPDFRLLVGNEFRETYRRKKT